MIKITQSWKTILKNKPDIDIDENKSQSNYLSEIVKLVDGQDLDLTWDADNDTISAHNDGEVIRISKGINEIRKNGNFWRFR